MPYLIDGHNLIPKIPGFSLRHLDDEMELVALLEKFCLRRGKKAEVYFDKAPPGSDRTRKFGRVYAHFIRQGSSADDAIIHRLQRLGRAAKNWTLVSSDRQVQAAGREMGATVLSSEVFATDLVKATTNSKSPEKTDFPTLTDEELKKWLKIFDESGS